VNGIGDDKEQSTVSIETGFFKMIFTTVKSYKIVQYHREMTSGLMRAGYNGGGDVDTVMTKVSTSIADNSNADTGVIVDFKYYDQKFLDRTK